MLFIVLAVAMSKVSFLFSLVRLFNAAPWYLFMNATGQYLLAGRILQRFLERSPGL